MATETMWPAFLEHDHPLAFGERLTTVGLGGFEPCCTAFTDRPMVVYAPTSAVAQRKMYFFDRSLLGVDAGAQRC